MECVILTLCILMDSSIWFDTWDNPLYIFRGVKLYFFKEYSIFCLKVFFTFTNSVDPDEMQQYAAFHLGLH